MSSKRSSAMERMSSTGSVGEGRFPSDDNGSSTEQVSEMSKPQGYLPSLRTHHGRRRSLLIRLSQRRNLKSESEGRNVRASPKR